MENTPKEKTSTGKTILKTAIISAAVISVAVILISVIVFLCFPYEGYKFASNMGMDRLALKFAENYEDDGNIDGLVYCIDIADKLYDETQDPSYADKLIEYTQKFFEYDNVDEYFEQLDEYYNDEDLDFRVRVGFYSYSGRVISVNYKARTVVGGGEELSMLCKGEVKPLDEILDMPLDVMDRSYIFSAFNRQLLLNKSVLVSDSGEPSDLYDGAIAAVSDQLSACSEFAGDDMRSFYILHQLYYFVKGMVEFLGDNALCEDWKFFLDQRNVTVNGLSLEDAYLRSYDYQFDKGGVNEK